MLWNSYSPTPQTHLGRGDLIRLTLHPRTTTHDAKLFSDTTKFQKIYTCFDYIKLHGAPGNL